MNSSWSIRENSKICNEKATALCKLGIELLSLTKNIYKEAAQVPGALWNPRSPPIQIRKTNTFKDIQEISPEYSLEGLMLKLKLQYFGHLMRRTAHWKRPWCWERLKAGGEGDDRGWNGWMASPTQWTWVWASSGSRWWTGKPGMLQSMGLQRVRRDWATELNWSNTLECMYWKWMKMWVREKMDME